MEISDSTDQVIAQNIILRRRALNLSQAELARRAKISPVTLNKVENLKASAGRHVLEVVSNVLGCNRHDLSIPTNIHYVKPSPTLATVIMLLVEFSEASEDTRGKVFDLLRRS